MVGIPSSSETRALEDFRRARRQAQLENILTRVTGRSDQLLAFEDVKDALRVKNQTSRGLQEIPLAAIVGSVGRYHDFTRGFLPRHDAMEFRWARVLKAASDDAGWPPIEVYQVGDAYFVIDGNHRVSVARQLGMETIMAYVTEMRTTVPLTADVRPEELVSKAHYAEFLALTGLDDSFPTADLETTEPGAYEFLREHIDVHRYFLGLEQQRDIPLKEAAASWYEHVYLPIVRPIRTQGLLRDFPGRTEADLYLWLTHHQVELQTQTGYEIEPELVAADIAESRRGGPGEMISRVRGVFSSDEVEAITPRADRRYPRPLEEQRFLDLLVPIGHGASAWNALEQALVLCERERCRLRGLHIVDRLGDAAGEAAQTIQAEFDRRCWEAGVAGKLYFEAGPVAESIARQARWNDAVVLNMELPPGVQTPTGVQSHFRETVGLCPRPVLAVPELLSPLGSILLAYDRSHKATEALYISTYLAGRWRIPLVVAVATGRRRHDKTVRLASDYLRANHVEATFVVQEGDPAEVILSAVDRYGCEVIALGGYGAKPLVGTFFGSTADAVLRGTPVPVLICQ